MAEFHIPHDQLSSFCKRWDVVELAIFGSVLRPDFRHDSDVDLLVRFSPGSGHSFFDMVRMQDKLSAMFGRTVDLVSWRAVEKSRNNLRRDAILESAQVLYAA